MTAWPAITDKWVSYNNDVTHFSRKRRAPTSFPSFTLAYFYHGLSYASAVTPMPPPSSPTAQRVASLDVGHSWSLISTTL